MKLKDKIYSILFYFFSGLKSADKRLLAGDSSSNTLEGGGVEMNEQEDSVYKDLLRGELTERVKALRHEMYYVERESKKYTFNGTERATIKKNLFSINTNHLETSDGFKVIVVQDNYVIDNGAEDQRNNLDTSKYNYKYTINIDRNFIPRFRLEEFTKKIAVKEIVGNVAMLDIYVDVYQSQFDTRQKIFLREMERALTGVVTDEIKTMDRLSFVTFKAYGKEDLLEYSFNNIEFHVIIKFEGYFVLKYYATIVDNGVDELSRDIYHAETAKKFEEKAPREGKNNADFGIEYAKYNKIPLFNGKKEDKTEEENNILDVYGYNS